jgi:hypothetical protein
MWAYGASRFLDYLLTREDLDAAHTAVVGHSRLGKTALWCGAQDERFFMTISNDSGYAGAATSKHGHGERVRDFLRVGSWDWYCENFKLFTDDRKLSLESTVEAESKELDEESLRKRHLLLTKLSDMGLSVRAYNCLKAADIDTFADLVSYQRSELMKFRNFGRKSLNEIDLLVEKMKLSFGMDVTKYNIEPKKKNV